MPIPLSQNYNPNFNYKGKPNYGYPDKKDKIGILIGTLLGTGMGAATGNNLGDSLLRGAEAGIFSYGTGLDKVQDYNTGALQQQSIADRLLYEPEQQAMERGMYDLSQKKFDQSVREYEEEKPHNDASTRYMNTLADNALSKASPEQQKYDREMARTKLGQEKNQLALSRNKLRGSSSEDMLNKHQSANIAHNIRNEIRLNPYVKDFQDVNQKYNVMQQALEESKNTGTLIAADQALITLFNKMTDPSSVVRESEYARTQSDQGILNRIAGKANKIMSGGAGLMPEEREALVRMAGKFYDIYRTNYDKTIADFTQLGTESGINPNLVNIPFKRKKDAMEELVDLAKSGDQEAIQYLQSKGLNK